jgi:predicted MFS family arabinose efflux permease
VLRRYTQLLRRRDVRIVLTGSLINGPSLGVPLALALAVSANSSFAAAGLVVAVNGIAIAATSPVRGRLLDRYGQTKPLLGMALLHAASLCLLAVLLHDDAPVIAIAAAAALAGAPAPLLGALRVLWSDLLGARAELDQAYALQAILNEALYVIAPLVVAGAAALISASAALIVLAAAHLLGVVIFLTAPTARRWRGEEAPHASRLGALASAGMRSIVVINIALGSVYGTAFVAVPAFAREHGTAASAGLVLAALSLGSVIGGIVYGAREWRADSNRRLGTLLLIQVAALAFVPLVDSIWVLGLLMALAGSVTAPLLAVCFKLLDDVAPAGTAAEATSWIVTSYSVGSSLGALVTGVLVTGIGVRAALAVAVAGALLACVVHATRARTLVGQLSAVR